MTEVRMKIKTIPQEYEAMQFAGDTKEFSEFINSGHAELKKNGDDYYLSCWLGSRGIDIGDYVYKYGEPLTLIGIAHNDTIFSKHFEIV